MPSDADSPGRIRRSPSYTTILLVFGVLAAVFGFKQTGNLLQGLLTGVTIVIVFGLLGLAGRFLYNAATARGIGIFEFIHILAVWMGVALLLKWIPFGIPVEMAFGVGGLAALAAIYHEYGGEPYVA